MGYKYNSTPKRNTERRYSAKDGEVRRYAERNSAARGSAERSAAIRSNPEREAASRRNPERTAAARNYSERNTATRSNPERNSAARNTASRNSAVRSGASSRQASARTSSGSRPVRPQGKRRKNKKAKTARILLICGILLFLLLAVLFFMIEVFPVRSSVHMEIGTEANVEDFVKFSFLNPSFTEDSEPFDTNTLGTYQLKIKAGMFTHKCRLIVEDTTAPTLEVKDLTAGKELACEAKDFVVSVEDATDVTLDFSKAPDLQAFGTTQDVEICATDTSGNVTTAPAKLTLIPIIYRLNLEAGAEPPSIYDFVKDEEVNEENTYIISDVYAIDYEVCAEHDIEVMYKDTVYPAKICIVDTVPPVFDLAEDFTSFLGDSIRYKEHVAASDNSGEVEISVDTSKVDPNTEGTYPVTYTATDAFGNTATVTINITISRKTPDEEALLNEVDGILEWLINDDMSVREKAEAIFFYVQNNHTFVDYSDKSSYVIAALDMIHKGQGDCYSYFALSKALLDRAGITNMDIRTNGSQEHYWNLVNIGDGHGWYHFDTTPSFDPISVFLWTEAEVQSVNDGRYVYDHSAYPEIP